jgi:hypothetical protein
MGVEFVFSLQQIDGLSGNCSSSSWEKEAQLQQRDNCLGASI